MYAYDLAVERRILHGLNLEWEYGRDSLDPGLASALRRPIFRLSDMKSRWGAWHSLSREIVLSRHLALNHSWYAVREVLFHEMAHQLAEEVLGGRHDSPHGGRFREACRLLRANPEASGNVESLETGSKGNASRHHPGDRALERAKKLLALAGSENLHEAQAAMKKAHDLMEKYNIDLIRSSRERSFQSTFLGKPALRHGIEKSLLANLVQDFYFVSAVWVPVYVVGHGRMGRALEASGTRENLAMAAHVFAFVSRYIDDQWKQYRKRNPIRGARKSEFGVGVIEGLRSRLEPTHREEGDSSPSGERSLVRLTDPLLKEYVRERYPCLRTSGRTIRQGSEEARRYGVDRGRGLVIHRPVEWERAVSMGRLLS